MKKTKILISVLMAVMIISSCFAINASAAEDLKIDLIPNKTSGVSVGDEIEIILKFPNIKASIGRLEAVAGTLSFDPEAFQFLKISSYVDGKYLTTSTTFSGKVGFFWYDEGYMIYKKDPKYADKLHRYPDQIENDLVQGKFLTITLKVTTVKSSQIYVYEHLKNQLIGTNKVAMTSQLLSFDSNGNVTPSTVYNPTASSTPPASQVSSSANTENPTSQTSSNSSTASSVSGTASSASSAAASSSAGTSGQAAGTGGGIVGKGSVLDNIGQFIMSNIFGVKPKDNSQTSSALMPEPFTPTGEPVEIDTSAENITNDQLISKNNETDTVDYTWLGAIMILLVLIAAGGIVTLVVVFVKKKGSKADDE